MTHEPEALPKRILVCGGRYFGDLTIPRVHPRWAEQERKYKFIMVTLDKLSMSWARSPSDDLGNWLPNVTIISGCARGVDSVAIDWATVNWCPVERYPAPWKLLGLGAGSARNQEMLASKPDLVVAFPGGAGTAHMTRIARAAGVRVLEIKELS